VGHEAWSLIPKVPFGGGGGKGGEGYAPSEAFSWVKLHLLGARRENRRLLSEKLLNMGYVADLLKRRGRIINFGYRILAGGGTLTVRLHHMKGSEKEEKRRLV